MVNGGENALTEEGRMNSGVSPASLTREGEQGFQKKKIEPTGLTLQVKGNIKLGTCLLVKDVGVKLSRNRVG